jgi:AcrR family transcriptional regulator
LARAAADLTREDWLNAGQALLQSEGLRALRLRTLTAALNISTGSFYHHFKDFDAYLGQLADYFSGQQLDERLDLMRSAPATPFERIRMVSELALAENLPRLMLAMRAWARSDPRAAKAVATVDETLIAFFAECLEGMGFDRRQALARGYLLVSSGTAEVMPPSELGEGRALRDLMLATICGRPPG